MITNREFRHISTNERYVGELPTVVSYPYTAMDGDRYVTKLAVAHETDPNYQHVLTAHMFVRGYILKDGKQDE